MSNDNLYGVVLNNVSDSAAARVAEATPASSALATVTSTLAGGLRSITSQWDQRAETNRRKAAADRQAAREARSDARQDEADQRDVTKQAALSDVAVGLQLINTGQYPAEETSGGLQPPDNLHSDITSAVRRVENIDASVSQGRMPAISRENAVNSLFQSLIAKFGPEWGATIAQGFRDNGVGNALTHEIAAEIDGVDKQRKAESDFNVKMTEIARSNLDPQAAGEMTESQLVDWGINYTRRDNELGLLQRQASLASTQQSTEQSAYNFDKDRSGDEYTNLVVQQVTGSLEPISRQIQALIFAMPESGLDPKNEIRLADLMTRARTTATNIINAQIARGGYPTIEAANKAREALTNYVNTTMLAPYESRDKSFAIATESITRHLGLSARLSAPLISDLKEKFGITGRDFAELLNAVPPNLIQGLKQELNGVAKPGLNQSIATIQLGNIVNVLRGERNLNYIDTPAERQQVVATTNNIVRNGAAAVAAGNGNEDMWANSARQLVIATQGISRQTPPGTLRTITTSLLSPNSVAAINRMMRGPNAEEARVLGSSTRAASVLVLQSTKAAVNGSINASSPYVVGVDEAGYLRIQPNRKWRAPRSLPVERGLGQSLSANVSRPAVDQNLKTLVDVANANLNFLQMTASWDGDAPKGTPIEVRRFWSAGQITPAQRRAAEQQKATGGNINQMFNALERDLSNVPETLNSSGGSSRGERNNNPGNLEDGAFTRSQPGYRGSDGRFAQFETPAQGEAAQEKLLAASYIGKGHNTIYRILGRYAPRSDNAASFDNYARYVARRMGVGPNDTLTASNVRALARAMREFETGNTVG